MKPITLEWIDKAEGDWYSAQRESRARKRPNYDAACFHAQQCVEKYLKAKLEEAGIGFSRTHNLIHLLTLVLAVEPTWTVLQPRLTAFNVYALPFAILGFQQNQKQCRERAKRLSGGAPHHPSIVRSAGVTC